MATCSKMQHRLFPDVDTYTGYDTDLIYSISTVDSDFQIMDNYDRRLHSWHSKETDEPIYEFVLHCLVRNGRLRVSDTRELLLLWDAHIGERDSDISLVLDYAVHRGIRELIRHAPAIDGDDDVIALEEVLDELMAFMDFVNLHLPIDTELMTAIEEHVQKINTLLDSHS